MEKNSWSVEDLRQKYAQKTQDTELKSRLEEYVNSLAWKQWKSAYHVETANNLWEGLFNSGIVDFGSGKCQKVWFSSSAEIESMIQVVHSMGDIFAQIANVIVLFPKPIDEDCVSLASLINTIRQKNIAGDVLAELLKIKDSNEFQYFEGFCNVIKHRKLIDTDYRFQGIEDGKPQTNHGIRFKNFEYKGKKFDTTFSKTIEEDYRLKIYDLICDAGIKLNNFLV